jgi:GDP-L-fucose synthase
VEQASTIFSLGKLMFISSKINKFYNNKKILITGGSGMIGLNLIKILSNLNTKITISSIDSFSNFKKYLPSGVRFIQADLRVKKNCIKVLKDQDYVFHLMAVKSNTHKKFKDISSAMVSHLLCNTNMLQSAFESKIKKFLFKRTNKLVFFENIDYINFLDFNYYLI